MFTFFNILVSENVVFFFFVQYYTVTHACPNALSLWRNAGFEPGTALPSEPQPLSDFCKVFGLSFSLSLSTLNAQQYENLFFKKTPPNQLFDN